MKAKYPIICLVAATILAGQSCKKDIDSDSERLSEPQLPQTVYNYQPSNIPSDMSDLPFRISPSQNHLTSNGATLGRVLFYDRALSQNNSISCGSCHKQQFGFADNKASSTGFELKKTKRNSMAIANVALQEAYFWDLRVQSLEKQVLMPVSNHIEMGMEDSTMLPEKLARISYYPDLFTKAFGSSEITTDRISKALSQFLRSMVSVNSKWDLARTSNFNNYTEQEKLGKKLFDESGCKSCHSNHDLRPSWNASANIGLDLVYADSGIAALPGLNNSFMVGSFQIPSLRNIALTAPYMHDGRFSNLGEVIDHYSHGIQPNKYLDWHFIENSNGPFFGEGDGIVFEPGMVNDEIIPKQFNFSKTEKDALIAFLKTLTDETLVNDPKFSDPFVKK